MLNDLVARTETLRVFVRRAVIDEDEEALYVVSSLKNGVAVPLTGETVKVALCDTLILVDDVIEGGGDNVVKRRESVALGDLLPPPPPPPPPPLEGDEVELSSPPALGDTFDVAEDERDTCVNTDITEVCDPEFVARAEG